MLIMGLALLFAYALSSIYKDGRHLNEMTTSLLVELELDDQRQSRPVLFSQMQVFSFLVDDCTEFLVYLQGKKHFLRTLSQQRVQQNSYADNTPRDNSPPSLHHSISLAPLLCSLSFFFFLSIFLPTQYENISWISTKRGRLEGEGGAFRSWGRSKRNALSWRAVCCW